MSPPIHTQESFPGKNASSIEQPPSHTTTHQRKSSRVDETFEFANTPAEFMSEHTNTISGGGFKRPNRKKVGGHNNNNVNNHKGLAEVPTEGTDLPIADEYTSSVKLNS